MKKDTANTQHVSITSQDVLGDILRQGARKMLATAIENEVDKYIAEHQHLRDVNRRHMVVRNGHLPDRYKLPAKEAPSLLNHANQYRGSIVNLSPATKYQIELPPEKNGIKAVPIYDPQNPPGQYALAPNSPGYDAGTIIPNFNDHFTGKAPDIGAFETPAPQIRPRSLLKASTEMSLLNMCGRVILFKKFFAPAYFCRKLSSTQ